MLKIAILAGETSGDNYGGLLAEKIKGLSPETFILGTGGAKIKEHSDLFIEMPYGKMGFSDVIKNISRFYAAYKRVVKTIDEEKPSLIVFIDNPGFNLKAAGYAGKKYPCFYYIPPKIWAHDYKRINIIKRHIKIVIPIFPFEKEIYEKANIEYRWFGHPAADLVKPHAGIMQADKEAVNTAPAIVGLLPGSREEEVRHLLPEFIKIAGEMQKERDLNFLLSASDGRIKKIEESILKKHKAGFRIIEGSPYGIINKAKVLFAASGTVNLEAALRGKPFIVFYKTSVLNYILAKMVVQLKEISPVNLMLGKKAVPEYIQSFPRGEIKKITFDILDGGSFYRKQIESFQMLEKTAGSPAVSEQVAKLVLDYAKK